MTWGQFAFYIFIIVVCGLIIGWCTGTLIQEMS